MNWRYQLWLAFHNIVAHPLLTLIPPLGEWLYNWSADGMIRALYHGRTEPSWFEECGP